MNQKLNFKLEKDVQLWIKREDLLHPLVSGNKFRKLKYNLEEIKNTGKETVITFGGAFSNHILATAAAGNEFGIKTVGVIRGDELIDKINQNPTLDYAQRLGMSFEFVSREQFSNKTNLEFIKNLEAKYTNCYILPEGGTNELAIKGCMEILTDEDKKFDFICCAVGTGGTIAGIVKSASVNQTILGFSALKGTFLSNVITTFVSQKNWRIIDDYHFGGYGKVTDELVQFMNTFYLETKVPLDPVYTGKMAYGVMDLIEKDFFPEGSNVLLIHTGGLQGIKGINLMRRKKNKLLLQYED